MTKANLERNFKYVQENWDSLLNLYPNKFVLVYDEEVVDSYDSYEKAAERGVELYGIEGNFLVQFLSQEVPNNFILHAEL